MKIKVFALIIGIVFILVGIMGFIPALTVPAHMDDPSLSIENNHGRLFGLFPVNALHNIVHILLGAWALMASRNFDTARTFCRGASWIYGILAIMGFFPGLNTVFGFIPIHGHDIWLHGFLAAVLAFFGYAPARIMASPTSA